MQEDSAMEAYGGSTAIEARLAAISVPVRLVFFTQTFGCDTCLMARQVVDELSCLSEQISVEEYNLVLDKSEVADYRVDRAPAIAIVGMKDIGIRYYGIPAGFEIDSMVEGIELVANGTPVLSDENQAILDVLDRDVSLQVFVTPT